jgi:outer membrane protein, heavy metal efflux system
VRHRYPFLALALCAALPACAGVTFESAVSLAESRSAGVAAQESALAGATSGARAADALPDPKVVLGVDNLPVDGPDRFSTSRDFMTMRRIGLVQEIPNADKRRARADGARAAIDREAALLAASRLAARRAAAIAWSDAWYREKRLAQLDELVRENTLLQQTAKAQVSGGRARPSDALAARQESLALADRRDQIQREVAQARAALRRAIGEAAETPLEGVPPRPALDAAALRAAVGHHTELAAYAPAVALVDAEAREIEASRKPDYGVQVSYQQRGPAFSNMLSLEVSFDLPISPSTRQDPRAEAKRRESDRLRSERLDAERRHAEELETDLAEYESLARQRTRLRDIGLPLAREKVDLATADYRAARGDLAAVLTARRELLEARLRETELDAQYTATFVRLTFQSFEARP